MINLHKVKEYLLSGKQFSFSKEYTHYIVSNNKSFLYKTCVSIYYDQQFILEISSYEQEITEKELIVIEKNPKKHTILKFDELTELMVYLYKNTMFSQSNFSEEFTQLRSKAEVEEIKLKLDIPKIKGNLTSNKGLSINKNSFLNNEETELLVALSFHKKKYNALITEYFNGTDEGLLETDIGYIRNKQISFDNFEEAFDYILGSTEITEEDFSNKFKTKTSGGENL